MKVYGKALRRCWYDRSLKLWTLQSVDKEGNQVGNVEYTDIRKDAMRWMRSTKSLWHVSRE